MQANHWNARVYAGTFHGGEQEFWLVQVELIRRRGDGWDVRVTAETGAPLAVGDVAYVATKNLIRYGKHPE